MKYKYVRLVYQHDHEATYVFRSWYFEDLKLAQRRLLEQQKVYPDMKWWLEKAVDGASDAKWLPLHASSLFS